MELLIIIIFVVGYLAIALEHPIKINKTASALLTAVICWTIFTVSGAPETLLTSERYLHFIHVLGEKAASLSAGELHLEYVIEQLGHHLNEISQILFFLMGAMTIVELVDAHHGFKFITDRIKTKNPIVLLWVVCGVAFFLSAVLDNLTTTIVMVSLIRKMIPDKQMRLFFAGMIVISANAGGAWSPIGDVTTTMLWIGGQISAASIMQSILIPSIVCAVVPLIYLTFTLKGTLGEFKESKNTEGSKVTSGNLMLAIGVGALISVPIFKTVTHLPPYMGMLLGLGVLWVVSELINPHLDEAERKHYTAGHALTKIDMPSVLFFLGILLAVGSLQSMGTLANFASYLNDTIGDNRIIITLIGVLSAIVDNVPLVAASMGMYSMEVYPMDDFIWTYLAYCAGTGGSILIIGSAAGVAAMGMEKIEFGWYLKRVSFLAALGYFAGAAVYLLMAQL
ncbi:MAG: sodium:proton antiporter NhaD [Algoriphagus sp.]|jgi:Na+/H+ antiporter NhaD/arsenite permease-like protein|uniref:sodium:proton antiporter NhaD n=2 Tax=Algoriphagus sp. TaxID=1872435 RepID=UPI002765C0B8|nr:sodium:proton antiporter NhaD [Algoriphagus sp.]MDP4747051.1 sodium:proton antiporter NhaD [Algoriphagus sp.]MDP4839081.1 sodium:proton antiporter NhaD [Algoriphagus sp.]MDP4904043.1 sodium:proton antiporter NhaD [Algoriphagus sp.]MDP4958055.1 sodium:proton antiporter NhaD [Algoriphagus sp.]